MSEEIVDEASILRIPFGRIVCYFQSLNIDACVVRRIFLVRLKKKYFRQSVLPPCSDSSHDSSLLRAIVPAAASSILFGVESISDTETKIIATSTLLSGNSQQLICQLPSS